MHLPQEIIDYIVDFVRNDRRTLATLRLLSHAWNNSASLHLFRTVRLDISGRPEYDFKVILSLLVSSTETISHCVRRCIILCYSLNIPTNQQNDYAVLMLSIVSRFTHMSEIEFQCIHWSTLTPALSSCILGICKSSTLEQIEFGYCSMPTVSTFLDILQASSNLKTLRLLAFKIEDVSNSKRPHPTPSSSENQYCINITTPFLHSLAVYGASVHLLHVIKVDNLKQLHWDILPDNVSGTEFLKRVGQSLESLVMDFTLGLPTLRQDLSHCPRLHHLCISNLLLSPSVCPSTYFCSLFVETADQSPPIERLELVVVPVVPEIIRCKGERTSGTAGLRDYCHLGLYQHQCQPQCQHDDDNSARYHCGKLCHSGWLTVDDSLSRSQIFQSLKTLEISVHQHGECVVNMSSLSDVFPKLKNKGVQVVLRNS